ncbi:hypothetical protein, partial [Faecalibacterium prausnitzii]|uniref:hypothetical protein n=1 Tax=Faecalibacterium prausnitzii TaxID=853 RepID=UPI003D6D48A6
SDLNIVSAQTGKVFDEHSGGFSLFKLLHHFNETGTVHGHAGNAIIQKVNQIGIKSSLLPTARIWKMT